MQQEILKRCSRCKADKSITDYARRSKSPSGFQPYCRTCQHEYYTNHYVTAPGFAERARARAREVVKTNQEYVRRYLSLNPCVDCGRSDCDVLEFDHVRGLKRANVSKLVKDGASVRTLDAEIQKCVIRCVNCHKKVTSKLWEAAREGQGTKRNSANRGQSRGGCSSAG